MIRSAEQSSGSRDVCSALRNISQGTKGTHSFFVFDYAKALGSLQLRKRPLLIEFTIWTIFTFIQSCSWNFYSIIVFDWNEHTSFLRLACMILVPKICNIHNSASLVVVCKSWTLGWDSLVPPTTWGQIAWYNHRVLYHGVVLCSTKTTLKSGFLSKIKDVGEK